MSEKKKYLVACGGHGRVILDSLISTHVNIDGIIDPSLRKGNSIFNIPVVGDDLFLMRLKPIKTKLINGFGVSKDTRKRKEKFEEWTSIGFEVMGTIHSSVLIGAECTISPSAQVMAGVVLQNRIRLEENVVVNTRASIDHDCQIGKHSFISPGAVICGGVTIAEKSFIGAGAVILPGISIGEGATVGAGAVVTKNVSSYSLVVGNPAKVMLR